MTMGNSPWTQEQIDTARSVGFSTILAHLGAHHKIDSNYVPMDPGRKSKRVQVSCQGRDYRFIFTGEKFVNELMPEGAAQRGGGGAIDFVRHVTGCNFVQAVKTCLDALSAATTRSPT